VLVHIDVEAGATSRRPTSVGTEMGMTLDLPVFAVDEPNAEAPKPVLALLVVLVEPKPPKPPNDMMMYRRGGSCY
jgi:hypothetical protein